MNAVFLILILVGYLTCAYQQWLWKPHADPDHLMNPMQNLTEQMLLVANEAVILAIGLVGVLSLFLGLMRIAENAGILNALSKLIYPLLKWLFPDIPPNHPAFGAMMMNFSANIVGLGNAATPFGLKAMQELNTLNPHPGIATNAMVLFLAINTSSITLIPTKVIALRMSAGSENPAAIIATTLVATCCSTVIAIIAAKVLQRFSPIHAAIPSLDPEHKTQPIDHESMVFSSYPPWVGFLFALGFLALIPLTIWAGTVLSAWMIPTLMVLTVLYGWFKKVNIYQSFVDGARAGWDVAIQIMPFLIAILVAIAMIRASGALQAITDFIGPYTSRFGLPAEALPMVLIRPLSGSGSLGVLSDLFADPHIGPDSYVGYLTSTLMGSTETTFYVLAVYFGAIQIKIIRHALAVGLIAELAGVIASIIAVKWILF